MTKQIIYASATGNTKSLAETIYQTLEEIQIHNIKDWKKEPCDLLFIGYWVFEGNACKPVYDFLSELHNQKIALFGSMGATPSETYTNLIMKNVESHIPKDNQIVSHFLCQGKLASSMKKIYEEKIKREPENIHLQKQLENFEVSQTHPSKEDLINLQNWAKKCDKMVQNMTKV